LEETPVILPDGRDTEEELQVNCGLMFRGMVSLEN